MRKFLVIFSLIAIVVSLPILLKHGEHKSFDYADDVVVVITPHNEAIRFELEEGFRDWYKEKTGRNVVIDWRSPGSTGDIILYVDSMFTNAFRVFWENTLGQKWTQQVQMSFSDNRIKIFGESVDNESIEVRARREFLQSNVGCGIDVFFGGGVIEHKNEASMGQLVSSGVVESHPEIFNDNVIPAKFAGDRLWDVNGRWIGSSLSSFGIVYNTDKISSLKITQPKKWADLTDYRLYKQVAMVDPIQSSIVIKCFEMMIQQQMQILYNKRLSDSGNVSDEDLKAILNDGWDAGFKLIQKLMANSRYFTDNSTKTIWDVSSGNCTAGVVVDFYGRYQKEILQTRNGPTRIEFVMPTGGTSASPDPISMFRGAPNPEIAKKFIEFVISDKGQKLIGYKVGVNGGPKRYPLSRTPIRKDFYTEENKPNMLSPDMNPFIDVGDFNYNETWTAQAFKSIRFLSKVIFVDTFKELSDAWQAIIFASIAGNTNAAEKAINTLQNFDEITYDWAIGELRSLLRAKSPLKEVELSTELSKKFRKQYILAKNIATRKK